MINSRPEQSEHSSSASMSTAIAPWTKSTSRFPLSPMITAPVAALRISSPKYNSAMPSPLKSAIPIRPTLSPTVAVHISFPSQSKAARSPLPLSSDTNTSAHSSPVTSPIATPFSGSNDKLTTYSTVPVTPSRTVYFFCCLLVTTISGVPS